MASEEKPTVLIFESGNAVQVGSRPKSPTNHGNVETILKFEGEIEVKVKGRLQGIRTGPRVGVGILIESMDGHILLAKRKTSRGFGQYSIPGGAVKDGEFLPQAAKRELREETGLHMEPEDIIGPFTHFEDGEHWVSIIYYICTQDIRYKVANMEPDKHEDWIWYPKDKLPSPLFGAIPQALEKKYKHNFGYAV